jgi:hypothetical protein
MYFDVSTADMVKVRDSSVNFYAGSASTTYSYGNSITDGQSRLYPMSDVINSLIAAYTAKKTTIINRGPLGILAAEGGGNIMQVPLSQQEEDQLHLKLRQKYGTQEGQRQEIITKQAMKWVQINKDIKSLMLFEEVEAGTREICAVMDYPFELLGYGSGSSLAGGGKFLELKKMLYTDSVIPGTEAIGIALTNIFLKAGQYLKPYFDHLDIFQRSRKEDADAMKVFNDACKVAVDGGAMTVEEWRAMLLEMI